MKELTCLSEEVIQQWIDGELDTTQQVQVHLQITSCEKCSEKAEQLKVLAFSVKKMLTVEDVAIPEFTKPEKVIHQRFPLWLKIAVVLLPAFCLVKVLLQPEKTYLPSQEELLMYQSLSDMDANAAFQERVMVTTATNQEGKIVEIEIY